MGDAGCSVPLRADGPEEAGAGGAAGAVVERCVSPPRGEPEEAPSSVAIGAGESRLDRAPDPAGGSSWVAAVGFSVAPGSGVTTPRAGAPRDPAKVESGAWSVCSDSDSREGLVAFGLVQFTSPVNKEESGRRNNSFCRRAPAFGWSSLKGKIDSSNTTSRDKYTRPVWGSRHLYPLY